ncbi:MAG: PAS domain S-box protein [Proteobacteria bacterium]|nr:PAS domain S-box protein [Pseudomonadota bacterium]
MKQPLRVLVVEDSEFDAKMLVRLLDRGGYATSYERVQTADAMAAALANKQWDLVLSDYNLPGFNATLALQLLQATKLDIPFIIVSGGIGEDIAVASMKSGANDYLMKGNLARLVPAVERELRDAAVRQARHKAENELRESEQRYRLLWETATDAILLMDTNSAILFANPAVQMIFGYSPSELLGRNFAMLLPEKLRETSDTTFQRQGPLVTTAQRRTLETTGLKKDGSEVLLELAFNDMELGGQRLFVAFIRDITERERNRRVLLENAEQFRVAREIQQHLFPKVAPHLPGFDVAGASFPAAAAGGDYFDFVPMAENGLGLVVGDVTGHGIGPALLMAETRAYVRIAGLNRADPAEVLTRTNIALAEDIGSERFVTLFLGRLDAQQRLLTYVSAGHPPGFVLAPDGSVRMELRRTGVPLGIRATTEYRSLPPIVLHPGELVLLLTDGIEEAMGPDEEMFGTDRMLDVLRANRDQSAARIVDALYLAVRDFCKGAEQQDDVTVIVLKVL